MYQNRSRGVAQSRRHNFEPSWLSHSRSWTRVQVFVVLISCQLFESEEKCLFDSPAGWQLFEHLWVQIVCVLKPFQRHVFSPKMLSHFAFWECGARWYIITTTSDYSLAASSQHTTSHQATHYLRAWQWWQFNAETAIQNFMREHRTCRRAIRDLYLSELINLSNILCQSSL